MTKKQHLSKRRLSNQHQEKIDRIINQKMRKIFICLNNINHLIHNHL